MHGIYKTILFCFAVKIYSKITCALPDVYAFAAISLRHVRFARMERRTVTFIDVFGVIGCCGLSNCPRRKQSDAQNQINNNYVFL